MKNLIPLGAVNLLLVSVYLVPVWTKDALRVLNSPFGGLHDRSHAAAVGLIREFLGLGIDGMLVVSQVLAGLKLLVVAAMVAFYIDVIRAVAERREPDRATIDTALTLGFNHPMGPLELGDLTGWDTRLAVLQYLHQTLGEKFRPCPLINKMVKAGRTGRKSGHGIYVYENGRKVLGSGLKASAL